MLLLELQQLDQPPMPEYFAESKLLQPLDNRYLHHGSTGYGQKRYLAPDE